MRDAFCVRGDVVDAPIAQQVARDVEQAEALPDALRCELESVFRCGFGGLKLRLAETPSLMDATAFACGDTIVIQPEAFRPATKPGFALLVHEAAHVLQQRGASEPDAALRRCDDQTLEVQAELAAAAYLGGSVGPAVRHANFARAAIQCQPNGSLNMHYLNGGTMNPAGGPITFAANNSMNEVFASRAQAFARAKALLEIPVSTAKRTYHFWIPGGGIANGEGLDIAGNNNAPMLAAAAAQRTGRYYDFGHGKLIVEHPDDPNSWTAQGGGPHIQRGHFHCCQYQIAAGSTQSMYMPFIVNNNFAQVQAEPTVYDWDRRFRFVTPVGGVTGHHIYYH